MKAEKDFECPPIVPPVDYLQIQGWNRTGLRFYTETVKYEIPRTCVEALGIRTEIIPPGGTGQGAIWFTAGQSAKLQSHRHSHFLNRRKKGTGHD